VIHIPSSLTRGDTTGQTECARDCDHVYKRAARSQLNEAEFVFAPFHSATENPAIEVEHLRQVDNAEDDVVDLANLDHAVVPIQAA